MRAFGFVIMPSPVDLSYIAAFFDGEGCIAITRSKPKERREYLYSVDVYASNTKVQVLSWMRDSTRLGVVQPKHDERPTVKRCWIWRLRNDEVRILLPQIMPYLKIKLQQAELVLEFLDLESNSGREVPEQILIQRQVIFEELAELNKRGV